MNEKIEKPNLRYTVLHTTSTGRMHDMKHGSFKVPDERVMKARVGENDEVLEKREERVYARLAKGIVAPVAVNSRSERE